MNRNQKYILLVLALLIAIGLALVFRSFLMTYFIEPVALLVWVFWRIFSSLDQGIYWVVLIVICAILVARLLTLGRQRTPPSRYSSTYEPADRVEHWRLLISNASLGRYESKFLRDSLKRLLIAVITADERPNSHEISERLLLEDEFLSPEARRFLFPSKEKETSLSFFIPEWFRKRARIFNDQKYALIEEFLKSMETDLEISNEE